MSEETEEQKRETRRRYFCAALSGMCSIDKLLLMNPPQTIVLLARGIADAAVAAEVLSAKPKPKN